MDAGADKDEERAYRTRQERVSKRALAWTIGGIVAASLFSVVSISLDWWDAFYKDSTSRPSPGTTTQKPVDAPPAINLSSKKKKAALHYAQHLSDSSPKQKNCDEVTAAVLAAQIDVESGWDPEHDSGAAVGLAHFTREAWGEYGADYDGDGDATASDPEDSITAQAMYMCATYVQAKSLIDNEKITQSDATTLDIALALYMSGESRVTTAGGVPKVTQNKLRQINDLIPKYRALFSSSQ